MEYPFLTPMEVHQIKRALKINLKRTLETKIVHSQMSALQN